MSVTTTTALVYLNTKTFYRCFTYLLQLCGIKITFTLLFRKIRTNSIARLSDVFRKVSCSNYLDAISSVATRG